MERENSDKKGRERVERCTVGAEPSVMAKREREKSLELNGRERENRGEGSQLWGPVTVIIVSSVQIWIRLESKNNPSAILKFGMGPT
jgi:hypothetical protein